MSNVTKHMHVLFAPHSSIEDGESRRVEYESFKLGIAEEALAYQGDADVSEENLGLGADWVVFAVEWSMWLGAAVLVIPDLHRHIRESAEECKMMRAEIQTLLTRFARGRRMLRLPDQALYLAALERTLSSGVSGEVSLLSIEELPAPVDGTRLLSHKLFAFRVGDQVSLVAITPDGDVFWSKTFDLDESNSLDLKSR